MIDINFLERDLALVREFVKSVRYPGIRALP
jgi:hypothetical protein